MSIRTYCTWLFARVSNWLVIGDRIEKPKYKAYSKTYGTLIEKSALGITHRFWDVTSHPKLNF